MQKTVLSNLQDKRQKRKPKFKIGDSVRTADIKRIFGKRDTTNWSNKLYKIKQIIEIHHSRFEADNEIDNSDIGNSTTNIYRQNPVLIGYHIISDLYDVLNSGYYNFF